MDRFDEEARRLLTSVLLVHVDRVTAEMVEPLAAALRAAHADGQAERDRLRAELEAARAVVLALRYLHAAPTGTGCYDHAQPLSWCQACARCAAAWDASGDALARYDATRQGETET